MYIALVAPIPMQVSKTVPFDKITDCDIEEVRVVKKLKQLSNAFYKKALNIARCSLPDPPDHAAAW